MECPGLCGLHSILVVPIFLLWISSSDGLLRCDCNTQECSDAGMTTCIARKSCYTELYQNVLNRGCDPTPLACENRKPSGLKQLEWPALYCCHHKNLCNKHAIPTISTPDADVNGDQGEEEPSVSYTSDDSGEFGDAEEEEEEGADKEEPSPGESNCSNSNPEQRARARTKIVNPIYIAVPVAGVCVLLALIIFAMYLLRRRTDYHHPQDSSYNSHHHYHHEHGGPVGHKKSPGGGGGGGGPQQQQQSVPGQHHQHQHHPNVVPHHCHCMCKKQPIVAMPPCGKGSNRCTDSERSSSGSETRLFLQS